MKARWIILATLAGGLTLGVLGFVTFLYSGVYDMAATNPHSKLVRPLLLTLKRSSVKFHARHLEAPELEDSELIKRGFVLYRRNCVTCHGAPGEARSPVGKGLNPNPPPLERAAEDWTAAEVAWIVKNGLKMAGMPGFALGEEPRDLWALTAFVMRMNTLPPAEYRRMLAWSEREGEGAGDTVEWLPPNQGWETLGNRGDEIGGRRLIRQFGCGTCHEIPGVPGARGAAGPPLTDWAKRHYIAGTLVNNPNSLVSWIVDPQAVEPGTAMPSLGVAEAEAWDMARYLYSLGRDANEPPRSAAERLHSVTESQDSP